MPQHNILLDDLGRIEIRNQRKRLFSQPTLNAVVLLVALFLTVFSIYPLLEVFIKTIWIGEFDFSILKKTMTSKSYWKAFRNSLALGISSACMSTIIGFIFAYAVVRTDMICKKFFHLMAMMPIVSPPFVMALAMILLFGRSGLISKQLLHIRNANVYGFKSLLVVQTLAFFPLAYLNLKGVLESINRSVEDAAESLGASRWQVFRRVTFPLCLPAIFSSFLLVFIKSISDFGNPQLLGGNYTTLSSQAYLQINGMYDTRTGSLIAISILLPSMMAFLIERYWVSKKSFVTVTGKPQNQTDRIKNRRLGAVMTVICSILTLIIIIFYGTVIWISLVKTWGVNMALCFDNFKFAFSRGGKYIRDSLVLALIATPLTAAIGMVISYLVVRKKFIGKRYVEFASLLTFAVPGIVLGIGYILAFNTKPIILTGTAAIVILALIFRNMSIGIEAGSNTLRQIDPSIEEAGLILGSSTPHAFMHVTLPLMKSAVYTSMVNTFVRSMTSISAVIFLVSARWNLLTVMIMSEVENSRFGSAAAYCVILIVIVLISFALLNMISNSFSGTRRRKNK